MAKANKNTSKAAKESHKTKEKVIYITETNEKKNGRGQKVNDYGLIERHVRFCEEYIITLNGRQSAINVGFSEKSAAVTASELLINPNIVAYLQFLRSEQTKRTQVNADYVIGTIVKVMEQAQQGNRKEKFNYEDKCMEVVKVETDNGLAEVWERDNAAVLKAAQLLGQHLDLWKTNVTLQPPAGTETTQKVVIEINHRRKGDKLEKQP